MLFLIFLLSIVQGQNYCKRSGITTTVTNECLTSINYDVENCCYECLQIDVVNQNSVIKCGSIYALGFDSCSTDARTAALKACGGGVYTCLCNQGNNKTQVNVSESSSLDIPILILALLSLLQFIILV
jgi:hypothetical protein